MLKEIVKYDLKVKGATSKEYIDVKSPYSGETIASIAQADEKAIKQAIATAADTFKKVMRYMPAHQRSEILAKTSQALLARKEELAKIIALEGGKPIRDARIEVTRAAGTFQVAAEEALRLNGEHLPMDRQVGAEGRLGIVLREPIGVVAAITPFNFPINLVAHKLAPALAAGNTVVLKPATQTPISSFKLYEILVEAGLPPEAVQLVPCRGSQAGALVSDPRLACLTFTGSPSVGWRLRREIADGVRIILELGGNAGCIVCPDADLDAAAKAVTKGGFVNAGQSCISVQRVYVHESVYDKFLQKFIDGVKALKAGDPLDESTDVGPIIDKGSAEKTIEWIETAVKGGAKVAAGGKLRDKNVVEPTVLTDTDAKMLVICQEVFAPLVSVMKYKDIEQAFDLLNDEHYGLQSGIFTQNLEIAMAAARKLDTGGVMVNDVPTWRADHMPYGGRRESGLGLEGVRYALAEMTQPKFICLNLPPLK